jgi:hypothetical protein
LEGSTAIGHNDIGLNQSVSMMMLRLKINELGVCDFKRTTKLNKQEKVQYNLAQQNPPAFFEELKNRLLAYQTKNHSVDDDPLTILDIQIAKTIDDADNYLFENSITYFPRYDSGVGTDSSEK